MVPDLCNLERDETGGCCAAMGKEQMRCDWAFFFGLGRAWRIEALRG